MSHPLQMIPPAAPQPEAPAASEAPGNPLAGRRVAIQTMGCRVNRFDAAQLRAEFLARGCAIAEVGEPYDLFVLNTCTVTHQADAEARRLARRAKRKSPGATVAVTGCYAEVGPEALAAIPEIDLVIPNRDKAALVTRVAAHASGAEADASAHHSAGRDWGRDFIYGANALPPDPGGDTRLFLKVQEGCDVACAFCIIPTARGRSRSMPPEGVVATIRAAQRAGYREAILAGIHLGGYGEDLSPRTDFAGLLERVLAETDMPRIRFGSLEPWGLSARFINLFAAAPRLLPSLHLPLQSGAASVLKRMRRPCTPDFYRAQVERILAAKPDLFLSTDVLTGFPGETDAEFEEGFAFIESLPFSHLHVFPYSPRAGTPAAAFENPVPTEVRKARSERLIALSDAKRAEGLQRQVGTVTRVLVEADGRGHTLNNYLARIEGGAGGAGEIVTARVTGHDGEVLAAVPCPVPSGA